MRTPLQCLFSLVWIFVGFVVGWTMKFFAPDAPDFSSRLFMIVYGLVGWAVTQFSNGKKLHCGGTADMDQQAKTRYMYAAAVWLPLLLLAPMALVAGSWAFYFSSIAVIIAMLASEVGWGNPWAFIVGLHRLYAQRSNRP